ncbi:uncharacterized protein LOC107006157 [Solanum pennellii]|uniref:Uncharacterized protein LOC107006157 n=1 Tax=Solanum pennellii TaxID=28526 RepID=A0ABM1FQM3_SOLPN|nr:uncharacterized protein LOC107006157 [Solanum pennellii]
MEFPEVFPNDLLRIPPKCESDFDIVLLPDTNPISILPYHMALAELKELKIMPPRRDNARNANFRNANAAPPVPDQEVSNAEFRNSIEMVDQIMTNHNNWVHAPIIENGGSAVAIVRDIVMMNLTEFLGSQTNKDSQNFLDEIKKMIESKQKFSAPASSSASVPSSKNRYGQKVRELSSKSQGSVSGTKNYPTCLKCGKNHLGDCLARKEGCYGCDQSGHGLRDCPSR